jgi:hypothetical protein
MSQRFEPLALMSQTLAHAHGSDIKTQSRRSYCRTARTLTAPHPRHPYTPTRTARTEKSCPAPAPVETAGREARNILPQSKFRQVKEQRNQK